MLQVKNIDYSVTLPDGSKKKILCDVSADFKDGEVTVITGHNGSGKTTLAKIIMGIVAPDSGAVLLNGKDITSLSVDERARAGLAFAFQQPVKFKGLKVGELLAVAHGGKPTRAELCDCLSSVGLCAANYIDRELDGALSGGELKRIEIAMAFLRRAEVSVFDEPEAGIDIWSFDRLASAFSALRGGNRVTVIVSHQERIMRGADSIVLLTGGKIERSGVAEEMLGFIRGDTQCKKLSGGAL